VLQAAQDALSQYFIRRTPGRRSGGLGADRRKSVPSFASDDIPEGEGAPPSSVVMCTLQRRSRR